MRRSSRRVASALVVVALSLGCPEAPDPDDSATGGEPASQRDRPDVVIVTVDTLRVDRVGVYGYARAATPVIDSLAARGVRFSQATTAFPRTTPAIASLFTGLWPPHHGSREVWQEVQRGTFLAEIMQREGYRTLGVTANPACGRKQNLNRGFDQFAERWDMNSDDADAVTDQALEWLESVPPQAPVFLWVHYFDPHWPYTPPRSYRPQPRAEGCRRLQEQIENGEIKAGEATGNRLGIAQAVVADCEALYDASVAFTDAQIGRLIEGLRRLGRWQRAIVVFTSDHGENFGEEGFYFAHGPSVHDAALRVPLIVVGPNLPAGELDGGVARGEDVMPSVLTLAGVDPKRWPPMDGVDFTSRWLEGRRTDGAAPVALAESGTPFVETLPLFVGSGMLGRRYCVHGPRYSLCRLRDSNRGVFYDRELDGRFEQPSGQVPVPVRRLLKHAMKVWPPGTVRQHTARTPRWKLVEKPKLSGGYQRALYDLVSDPGETTDVTAQHQEQAAELGQLLDDWLQDLPIHEEGDLAPEEIEQLRTLGYVEN